MNRLLVIGSASTDTLHLEEQTVTCAGGAAMYTAMAARRCGAQVSLYGPRPDPLPEELVPVAARLAEWIGPAIPLNVYPRFEIAYREGKTEYLKVSLEAERSLSSGLLPSDLSDYDWVHVTPLGDASQQLSFVRACRQRGAKRISAGTGLFIVDEHPEAVREVIEQADVFFLNEWEARGVFGAIQSARTDPGKVLFVTLGEQGAFVIQGDHRTLVNALPASVLDPTGAGDSFCGATLAFLLQDQHPVMAARQAVPLAAEVITKVGPAALLSDQAPPSPPLDERVRVNEDQVRRVAEGISALAEVATFDFVGPQLPPLGHPQALDYFFVATLQQFSFWTEKDGRYHQPMIAEIGGVRLKGSDYLWEAFRRRMEQDDGFCSPQRQAGLSQEELLEVFRADDGTDPMPALGLHLEQANSYGRDMLALQLTPQVVVERSLAAVQSLQTFLGLLDKVGGYKEDPLRKKSSLLAMILNDRPERFLPLREDEQVPPVIDYHAMRSALRIGLVDVVDKKLNQKLLDRRILTSAEEGAVRWAVYRAFEQLGPLAGKSTCAVDQFFFHNARKRCPEMTAPQCPQCPLDRLCAKRKDLFQPVLRTTNY